LRCKTLTKAIDGERLWFGERFLFESAVGFLDRHSSTCAAEKDRTNCLETTLFIGKSPLRDA
jgi:hypothetical protein